MSVVMAAYNAEKYLRDAIDSILSQRFSDFEFIIVDDGSEDDTARIIGSYADARITRLTNKSNIGQTRSVNFALKAVRGEYVARMDADDVSEPHRFARQVEYLDGHPEVAVIATWVRIIQEATKTDKLWTASSNPGVLAWELTWRCPINNSSVMMRACDVREAGFYDPALHYAEDHRLWTDMVRAGKSISVLPEPLNWHRQWPNQIGRRRATEQRREVIDSAHGYVEWLLGRSVNAEQVEAMIGLYEGRRVDRATDQSSGMSLACEVGARCRMLYGGVGACEIIDRLSDALIFGAARALRDDARRQARRNILSALRMNPLRAARPWTFELLALSFVGRKS